MMGSDSEDERTRERGRQAFRIPILLLLAKLVPPYCFCRHIGTRCSPYQPPRAALVVFMVPFRARWEIDRDRHLVSPAIFATHSDVGCCIHPGVEHIGISALSVPCSRLLIDAKDREFLLEQLVRCTPRPTASVYVKNGASSLGCMN